MIGENYTKAIKMLLLKHGKTQDWLAGKLGISQPTLSQLFYRGTYKLKFLYDVANALEINFSEIVSLAESL